MGGSPIGPRVLKILQQYPNESITCDFLATDLNLSEKQVRSAIRHMINSGETSIKVIARGHIWRYESKTRQPDAPTVPPTPEPVGPPEDRPRPMYEEVGKLKGGAIVLRGPGGRIWKAEPL